MSQPSGTGPQTAGRKANLPQTKVFVEGRYRKLTRDLPQTVFFCPECKGHVRRRKGCATCEGFGKLTRDSVQELIGWVAAKAFGTRKNKFHGAGREDVDVRMLGRGRPFVLEMVNPKLTGVDLAELEEEINRRNEGRLEIQNLHWTERTRVRVIKETPHAKLYSALVEFEEPIERAKLDALVGQRIEIVQETPQRVAHRRAVLDRTRWIEIVKVELLEDSDDLRYQIDLRTEHGTYVKEVLSGEEGRTRPSLGGLVDGKCRCVELDVLEILDEEGESPSPAPGRPPAFGEGIA